MGYTNEPNLFQGFMYLLNSRGNYRKVSSVRTADFAATLDRSGNAAQVHTGPRGLNGLKFAPNEAAETRGSTRSVSPTSKDRSKSHDDLTSNFDLAN